MTPHVLALAGAWRGRGILQCGFMNLAQSSIFNSSSRFAVIYLKKILVHRNHARHRDGIQMQFSPSLFILRLATDRTKPRKTDLRRRYLQRGCQPKFITPLALERACGILAVQILNISPNIRHGGHLTCGLPCGGMWLRAANLWRSRRTSLRDLSEAKWVLIPRGAWNSRGWKTAPIDNHFDALTYASQACRTSARRNALKHLS
jgi:hypothetical protein